MQKGKKLITLRDTALSLSYECRFERAKQMTGDQSRVLQIGDRVCWQNDKADKGTITEMNWLVSRSNGIIAARREFCTTTWTRGAATNERPLVRSKRGRRFTPRNHRMFRR